jgi:Cu(I)/Ag(I) efflux system membrane fusion protein
MNATIVAVVVCALLYTPSSDPEVREASFPVTGNCGQCRTRIEKAVKIEGVKYAKWDKKKQMLSVAFLSPPLSADSLERRVAAAGHDTGKYRAPDSVYEALPGCCLYRDAHDVH